MARRDYYEVLGVSRECDDAELKKAYRRLAMKYHPDRNADDASAEERFKEVKEAHEVLSDPKKRAAYDRFGHAGLEGAAGGAGGGFGNAGFRDIFDDVFGDIFGARAGSTRSNRGADLRHPLELDLDEAVFGTTATLRIPSKVRCGKCSGSGVAAGKSPTTCATCEGSGQVRMQQGFFSIQQTCPRCRGRGQVITDPCRSCRGEGWVRENKTLSVKIPAGVDSGDRIRLAGEGEPGAHGGPSGDLYVEVAVREHEIFAREGNNLYCAVPISFATAALGGDLEIPTLNGRVNLKIPPETQTGRLFRLRGKGIKSVRGQGVGDLVCRVDVETPVALGSRQKELLRKFDESLRGSRNTHDPKATSWLDSVRRFFEGIAG